MGERRDTRAACEQGDGRVAGSRWEGWEGEGGEEGEGEREEEGEESLAEEVGRRTSVLEATGTVAEEWGWSLAF
jgi:hypothetical protein